MKIQNSIQSSYSAHKSPSFQAHCQDVKYSASGMPISLNNTSFFRQSFRWKVFVDGLAAKYKDFEKVNIHCFACSDGSEPFSLASLLINRLGEKVAKKFLPILASDVDSNILIKPQNGEVLLSRGDIGRMKACLGDDYKKYIGHDNQFSFYPSYNSHDKLCKGKVSQVLRDAVQFKQMDVLEGVNGISKGPSVVMISNVWPYFGLEDRIRLSEKLNEVLCKDSMIVTGAFDHSYSCKVEKILKKAGFSNMSEFGLSNWLTFEKTVNHLSNPEFLKAQFIPKLKV